MRSSVAYDLGCDLHAPVAERRRADRNGASGESMPPFPETGLVGDRVFEDVDASAYRRHSRPVRLAELNSCSQSDRWRSRMEARPSRPPTARIRSVLDAV